MRRHPHIILALLVACGLSAASPSPSRAAPAQATETVDRILARIESDIILLSEARELAAYQQLLEGHAQSQDELLRALIEQWVVRSEAQEARFPAIPAADVDAEIARIQSRFPNPQAFRERLASLGLGPQSLRRMVEQQFYLARYLDYKFRPAVQVDDSAIFNYYQQELAPALRAQGRTPAALEDVRDQIRELLVQRGISERADTWFDETKSRLQIEIEDTSGAVGKP